MVNLEMVRHGEEAVINAFHAMAFPVESCSANTYEEQSSEKEITWDRLSAIRFSLRIS